MLKTEDTPKNPDSGRQSTIERLKANALTRIKRIRDNVAKSPLLRRFSIYVAGFHIYSHLTGILTLGAFSSWIANHWHGITRALWDLLLVKFLRLDWQLTPSEKDALTTVVFFLPLGLLSLVSAAKEASSDWMSPFSQKIPPVRRVMIRVFAMICGGVMVYILSHETFGAIWSFWRAMPIPMWLAVLMVVVVIPTLTVMAVLIVVFGKMRSARAEKVHAFLRRAFRYSWAAGNYLALGFLLYSVWLSVKAIGLISALAGITVFYFVLWAGIKYPQRLIHVTLFVLALLVVGVLSDAVTHLTKVLEQAS